jgi:hypothetical protein
MLKKPKQNEQTVFPGFKNQPEQIQDVPVKQANKKAVDFEPPNLRKAIRLPVPDFNNPNRPPVCLEQDFPIVPINALSSLEGNASKLECLVGLMRDDRHKTFPQGCGFFLSVVPRPVECLSRLRRRQELSYWGEMRSTFLRDGAYSSGAGQ